MNFASDNTTGAAPEILDALARANKGRALPYGNDDLTLSVEAKIAEVFETDATVFLVPTGTAANALALSALCPPYGAVYCHAPAHIHTDECGAPEFFTGGAKLVGLSDAAPTLRPTDLARELTKPDRGVHHVRPSCLSLSQAAETGAVYTPDALAALRDVAQRHRLKVHMDGARFANAVAALRVSPADLTWKAGVDILCFGATKNGALMAEAVVVFDKVLAQTLPYRRKRGGHLASKMRFLAAQFDAYLTDELWLRNARQANEVATRLRAGLAGISGISLAWKGPANEVFADIPTVIADRLAEDGFVFYRWDPGSDNTRIRLVTAFDSKIADADAFVSAVRRHGKKA